MEYDLIFGILAMTFGVVSLVGYGFLLTGREVKWFGKLKPMQKFFGKNLGTAIHFTFYVILPLVAGAVFITSSFVVQ